MAQSPSDSIGPMKKAHVFGPALVLAAVAVAAAPAPAPRVRAFVGARLFDGSGGPPVDKAILVVENGRFVAVGPDVAVPEGAERVDLGGRFVLPGLVNAHGHVGETRGLRAGPELYTRENVLDQLRLYARYGVTTVVSLGGDRDEGFRVRDEQQTPSLDRARLYVAGAVVDGTTPEAARAQVEAVAAKKPDWVKIRVDDNLGTTPKMTPEVYRAVIEEAHRRDLRVAAHLFYLEDARGLLDAGVDFLAHSVRDKDVDPEFVAELKRAGHVPLPDPHARGLDVRLRGRARLLHRPLLLEEAGSRGGGGAPDARSAANGRARALPPRDTARR